MADASPDHGPKCNTPRAFERVARFPPGQAATIGVLEPGALHAIAMLEQAGARGAKRPWWRFWN